MAQEQVLMMVQLLFCARLYDVQVCAEEALKRLRVKTERFKEALATLPTARVQAGSEVVHRIRRARQRAENATFARLRGPTYTRKTVRC